MWKFKAERVFRNDVFVIIFEKPHLLSERYDTLDLEYVESLNMYVIDYSLILAGNLFKLNL